MQMNIRDVKITRSSIKIINDSCALIQLICETGGISRKVEFELKQGDCVLVELICKRRGAIQKAHYEISAGRGFDDLDEVYIIRETSSEIINDSQVIV